MKDFVHLSDAAYSALCKIDPYFAMNRDPKKFRRWLERQSPITRARAYYDIGKRMQEQERHENV